MPAPRTFVKNLSLLLLLNVMVKPVWILLIDRAVQNELGFAVYGQYFALLNLSYVLYFLADAGLSNLLNQQMASGKYVALDSFVRLKIGLLFAFAAACLLAGWLTGIGNWKVFVAILLIQGLNASFVFVRSIVTARQLFRADAWLSVLDKSLMILFCAGYIFLPAYFGRITLSLFLQWQILATAIATATAIILLRNTTNQQETNTRVTVTLTRLLPFVLIILLMSAHYRLDGFLLERLHANGAYEAGVYAAAYRLLDAANMAGYLTASFLVPFVARHQYDSRLLGSTIHFIRDMLLPAGIALACFAGVYSDWLFQLLYHESSNTTALVLRLCLASLPAYFLTHIYGSVLTATNRLKTFIIILVFTVAANVVTNLLLIPTLGSAGAAWAAIGSQYLCAISCMMACRSLLPLHTSRLLLYLAGAVALTLCFASAKAQGMNVWMVLAIALILALLLVLIRRAAIQKQLTQLQ